MCGNEENRWCEIVSKVIHKIEYTIEEASFVSKIKVPTDKCEDIINLFNLENIEISIINPQYKEPMSAYICKKTVDDIGLISELNQPQYLKLKMNVCAIGQEKEIEAYIMNKKKSGFGVYVFPPDEKSQKIAYQFVVIFLKSFYLMEHGKDFFDIEERTIKNERQLSTHKSKTHKKSKCVTNHFKYYKIKNCEEIKRNLCKKHNITCNLWEVGGHLRKYKSGKTIYIKPYKKGKDRDKNVVAIKHHSVLPKGISEV